ncbi:unnamed protein product [Clonostachys rhizophaga]|uniref:Calcineurin-like phosphoesterase domain-containing protein n=1 Tax=Clonostachys rhizophaga TaxID=160324 RepID=A0A9N9YD45_9HYPO|nr:unnamed protein product [Clonostachys rhizophaga]
MTADAKIKTRILIISDTHGQVPYTRADGSPDTEDELGSDELDRVPTGFRDPLPKADVVLHCGDLTMNSAPEEYRKTFSMLRKLQAPIKLVIAGNHDRALDRSFWEKQRLFRPERLPWADEAKSIIEEARADGVIYLDEGVHTFDLENGARLRVYASPWTPQYGSWGFQYDNGHNFEIPPDVDVAMTHGPPYQVLDLAGFDLTNAGCPDLLKSIYMAKPQIHCFGHIHEAWGGYLARWKEQDGPHAIPKHIIDDENSVLIKKRKDLSLPFRISRIEDFGANVEKRKALVEISRRRGVHVDLTEGETHLQQGEATLFLNAAIMSIRYRPINPPWLVDLNLPTTEQTSTSS